MEITKITRQNNSKDRYSIFIDGNYSFSLSASFLADLGLYKGMFLKEEDLEELKKKALEDTLYTKSLYFLSFRPRSRKEILDFAKKYSFQKKIVYEDVLGVMEKVFERLERIGLVGDLSFAEWFVKGRISSKKLFGRRFVERELLEKGISKDIISTVLEDFPKEAGKETLLVVGKYYKRALKKNVDTARQKTYKYLISRGFSYSEAKKMIDSLASSK